MQHIRPPIFIPATDYDRLVALAEGAVRHQPDAAEFLLRELRRASTVAPVVQTPVVVMGSHVRYRDESGTSARDAQLVYPEDANLDEKRISILTPVGAALIGLSEGQTMPWRTRDGREKTLTVLEVRNTDVSRADGLARDHAGRRNSTEEIQPSSIAMKTQARP